MGINIENFEKFIIKQIVNTVDYHPETDEYEINRIHISDDIIKTIEEEGLRYGFDKNHIGDIILQVSENIRTTPAVQLRYDSIEVKEIKIGQHFRINVLHPEKGRHYVELLTINKYAYYVLSSDIMGVRYGDELQALDKIWNNGYYADFSIIHSEKKQHNEKKILRLGSIQNLELYSPSVVHEILDSEESFSYEKAIANKEAIVNTPDSAYYFWIPNKWKPITFCWKGGDVQDETSAFVVFDKENSDYAKLIINKSLKLPTEENKISALMEILFDCCKWKNAFNGIDGLKSIRTVKVGKVRKVVSEMVYKEWELENKPQIKFVYE